MFYLSVGVLSVGIGSGLFITGSLFGILLCKNIKSVRTGKDLGLLKSALIYGLTGIIIPVHIIIEKLIN
jgi:hypothetical protein